MGFISNQWLGKGQRLRNRDFKPVAIEPHFKKQSGDFSRHHKIALEVTMYQDDSNLRHELYLTQPEVEEAAQLMLDACSDEIRTQIALQIIRRMTDAQLLRLLATDLKKRV